MTEELRITLNGIFGRITQESFLAGKGVANEIRFYIQDYPASSELKVRDFIRMLESRLRREKPQIRFTSVHLFQLIVDLLRERGILEKAFALQRRRGNDALNHALKGLLRAENIADRLVQIVDPRESQLVLLHGLGSAYPLVRSHTLLECLHTRLNRTPMVVFFPGEYADGQLRLFGRDGPPNAGNNYYRAFRLVN